MTKKEEITEIPINKIRGAAWQPRQHFEREAIESLGASIKEQGLIQPITVRKDKTGDNYELIAGERRWKAATLIGMKTIAAIVKDVDDFTAKEISIVENLHREGLTDTEKEKFINDLWLEGLKAMKYTSAADMARKTGIGERTISRVIEANKERNSLKNRLAVGIQKANYQDLDVTRVMKDSPEARDELLQLRVDHPDKLSWHDMRKVVGEIKDATPETQIGVIKLIHEEKVEPKNLETFVKVLKESTPEVQTKMLRAEITSETATQIKVIREIPAEQQTKVIRLVQEKQLEPKQVETFVKVLKESAPDIQEKLLKVEITPDEAEVVKSLKTPEAREQVLDERRVLREAYEDNTNRHMAVRIKNEEDVLAGKQSVGHSSFDYRDLDEQRSNERTLKKYQNLAMDIILFRADHILSMKDKNTREAAIACVKQVVDHCNSVLIKVNELKVITDAYPVIEAR